MSSIKTSFQTEIIFLVETDPEGGYTARALGESIFTMADTLEELRKISVTLSNAIFPIHQNVPA